MIFKKVSDKWHKKYIKEYKMRIYDPDRWNRNVFDFSWYKEKITFKEFCNRALQSSLIPINYYRRSYGIRKRI